MRTAHAGDVIVIPAGQVHADPWATKAGPATITSLLSPAGPEWVDFGIRLGRATRSGQLSGRGQPPLPVVMRIVHESGADVFAPGIPAALAAVGRLLWRDR